jgi:tRNA/rRNA methyltransferase
MIPLCPLDNVRVILSCPSHPGNIGAAARAMKTMGLGSLYLVNPKSFPDKEAEIRSAGAWDVLNSTRVCTNLNEALSGTTLAAAVTARQRNLSLDIFDARQGARKILSQAGKSPVALVFGTEMSGLTSVEVSKCQFIVHIPANPAYSSLNLASAVQVMTYELRMALPNIEEHSPSLGALASHDEIELFYRHFENTMINCGFLDPENPKLLMQRIRRLYSRTNLEKKEISILRGMLNSFEKQK